MKKITTIVTEEFNENGAVISRTTETTEENDDNGYIYPQHQTIPMWVAPSIKPAWCERQCTILEEYGRD